MKTGVLCGLEYNPVTNTSLYLDHDMNIGFDVQISTVILFSIVIFIMEIVVPSVVESAPNNNNNNKKNKTDDSDEVVKIIIYLFLVALNILFIFS